MEKETIDAPVDTEPANESITDNQTQEVVTEPAKTSDNQEGQVTEPVETPQEIGPYTDEELRNVKDFKTLDPARLAKSYEAKDKAYKEMQGEYTRITQRQSTQPQFQRPSNPQDAYTYDVFQALQQGDEYTVDRMLNSVKSSIERRNIELAKAQYLDPDRATVLEKNLLADIDYRDRLESAISKARHVRYINTSINNEVDMEIFKEIPNFKEIAPEMGDFARKELHLDNEMIEVTMSPRVIAAGLAEVFKLPPQEAMRIAKKSSIGFAKALNIAYMRLSGKGIKDKENRIPNKTETKGSNFTHKSKAAKDMNDNELEAEINRLKFGGNNTWQQRLLHK